MSRQESRHSQRNVCVGGQQTLVGSDAQPVLTALQDEYCQQILGEINTTALSVEELVSRLDLSVSTTYRKVELLTDSTLVRESIKLNTTRGHHSVYVRVAEDVDLTVQQDGCIEITVTFRDSGNRSAGA